MAKKDTESVTKSVSSSVVHGNLQFIDNPGFNAPEGSELSDANLWIDLFKWIRNTGNPLIGEGFNSFINIVMIPNSMRVPKDPYMNVAKLLLSLTIAYPNFPIEDLQNGLFPKFYVIFTNFSALIEKNSAASGLEDYGNEED